MPKRGETLKDIEAIRAINAHRYSMPRSPRSLMGGPGGSRTGRIPLAFHATTHRNGLTVKNYYPRLPVANLKGHHKVKFSHLTRFGWKAYDKDGKVRMTAVRFLCGAVSWNVELSNEATRPLCAKCRVVQMGYEAASDALDAYDAR